jgi:ABC-type transporter Mla subunit MlaD
MDLFDERSPTMASLKDVETVADDLSNLVEKLRRELRQGASFDQLVQIADQISEHADEAATTFSTVNEALMGRLNDLKGDKSGSSSSGSSSRAKARA